MFNFDDSKKSVDRAIYKKNLEYLMRSYLEIPEDVHVLIQELNCMEADCPPKETIFAVFPENQTPFQFRLHKALEDITEYDLQQLFSDHPKARKART